MTAGGGGRKRRREAEEADSEEEVRRLRDVRKAMERRLGEEAEERRLVDVKRTWKSLGIARRVMAEHGYRDGEGGKQTWESTARRGSGEDRDMMGDALTAWQREKWKQLLETEDMWRWWAGVTLVGEAQGWQRLSALYLRCGTCLGTRRLQCNC